jgi:Ca2+-binding RTX toxin-like protein
MSEFLTAGTEFSVNTHTAFNQTAPSTASFSDGGFVVVWGTLDTAQDGSDSAIKAQRFDAAGNPAGPEFLVNNQAANVQSTADVATFDDGSFVVTWVSNDPAQDGSSAAVKARLFDASGAPMGPEFLVNTQTVSRQDDPHVTVLDNGDFVVSWNDWNGFDMKAQIFNADGTKDGGEFRLNTSLSANQEYGDVVALSGGGFVATWRTTDVLADGNGQAVIARVFNGAGAGGSEILVNTAATGLQYSPTIAGLPDGGFVVAWYTTDVAQDGNSGAIKAQIFDAAGARVGGEFLVNSQTANVQNDPFVVAGPDGGFAVVWTTFDSLQDGSSMAVKGQYFDGAGQRIGSEFLVNSLTAGSQFLPAAASLADGTLAVVWTSESGDGSGYAIRGRLFDMAASPAIISNGGGDSADIAHAEGQAMVTTVSAADADSPLVTYSIAGGADAALFTLDLVTGDLAFLAAPDFEAPVDADGDNVYEVIVAASDGLLGDTQTLAITVGNINEAPVITSDGGGASASLTVTENGTAVTIVQAGDVDGPALTYAIAAGNDAGQFAIDAQTGVLTFVAAPDFEAPADAGGDNVYSVTVSASDGSHVATQDIAIMVRDLNEAPRITSGGGSGATVGVDENEATVTTVTAHDPEGQPLSFAISGGADAARFAIDPATGALSFLTAPDFEAPSDADGDNVYDVEVTASDGVLTDTQAIAVGVSNMVDGVTRVGSGWSNFLTGTVAEDTLLGLGASDFLWGGAGDDRLDGGTGNDWLIGGSGADTLIGGSGADLFIFEEMADSRPDAPDRIADFSRYQRDRIDLDRVDANANAAGDQDFAFIGTAAFSGTAGQLRFAQADGNTVVMGDLDGDALADFAIQLTGLVNLGASDFLL